MRILLADDDKIERAALIDILKQQETVEMTEAEDGQQALDILCDGLRPELCIFDIRMPKIDGVELLRRVRRDPQLRGLKVVVTSASRDRDTIVALAKLQISGYLLKPYDATRARAILQPLLRGATAANPKLASRNLLAKTVLLVDDEPITRAAAHALIKAEQGWEVIECGDGADALRRLHAGLRPDLTLVDLVMPTLDGIGLIERIRDDPELRSLRIAVMSAANDRERIASLARLQVSQYALKPLDADKVSTLLRPESAEAPKET